MTALQWEECNITNKSVFYVPDVLSLSFFRRRRLSRFLPNAKKQESQVDLQSNIVMTCQKEIQSKCQRVVSFFFFLSFEIAVMFNRTSAMPALVPIFTIAEALHTSIERGGGIKISNRKTSGLISSLRFLVY